MILIVELAHQYEEFLKNLFKIRNQSVYYCKGPCQESPY